MVPYIEDRTPKLSVEDRAELFGRIREVYDFMIGRQSMSYRNFTGVLEEQIVKATQ